MNLAQRFAPLGLRCSLLLQLTPFHRSNKELGLFLQRMSNSIAGLLSWTALAATRHFLNLLAEAKLSYINKEMYKT